MPGAKEDEDRNTHKTSLRRLHLSQPRSNYVELQRRREVLKELITGKRRRVDGEETERRQREDLKSFCQAEHEGEEETGWKVERRAFRGGNGRKSSITEGDLITKEANTQRKA